jgi:predicted  nucleic acid-binding Zn ribbon protein
VIHLGWDPESREPCRCRKRPFLILFTTFIYAEPPLRCGACFGPVALHKVPATNEAGNHQDILWWQDTYQAMDWLFIGTGPGERFAHDQLSRFDSELSTDGREMARTLEKKVRVPMYYYLSKHTLFWRVSGTIVRTVPVERMPARTPRCFRQGQMTAQPHASKWVSETCQWLT